MRPPPDPVCVVKGNMTEVHCLLYDLSSDKELLFAGTQNGYVHIWDLQLNRECGSLKCGNESCLMLYKVGKSLIIQDKECNVKIWDIEDGNFIFKRQLVNHKHVTFCKMEMCNYNEENVLLIPYEKGEIKLYSLAECKLLHSFNPTSAIGQNLGEIMIIKTIYLCNYLHILIAYENGTVLLCDTKDWKVINDVTLGNNELPIALDFNSTHQIGIFGTSSNSLHVFTITDEDRRIVKSRIIEMKTPGCNTLKIRQDGRIFAAGCWDGKIRIYSVKTYNLLAVLDYHEKSILYVLFSHTPVSNWNCNYLLAVGGVDKKVSFWDIYN